MLRRGHALTFGDPLVDSLCPTCAFPLDAVRAVVEIGPFTRVAKPSVRGLRIARCRKGSTRLLLTALMGSTRQWTRYLDIACPGTAPVGYDAHIASVVGNLGEPGRMAALRETGMSAPKDAAATLAAVLRGYGIADEAMPHALRAVRSTLHGFAVLAAATASSGPPTPTSALSG
jgi:hypothetical protein